MDEPNEVRCQELGVVGHFCIWERGKITVVSTCRQPKKVLGEYPVWLKFPLFAIGLRARIALFRVALGMYDV